MEAIVSNKGYTRGINPKKFGLWVALGGISMMFFAFTSAYIVRQAAGNWLEFQLPQLFFISTLVILASSITIELAYKQFREENPVTYRALLSLTFLLGVAFVVLQWQGWQAMQGMGIELTGNPSGSFVYVISGTHAAHVLGGIASLVVAMVHAFVLPFKLTGKRKLRFQLVIHYWHFVGILWVYLFIFFTFIR